MGISGFLKEMFSKRNIGIEDSVRLKVERKFEEFKKGLSEEDVKNGIEEDKCLFENFCSHHFAIHHDGLSREKYEHIFSCWRLSHCLCPIKEKRGCTECPKKKTNRSLCRFYEEN